jgi:hypothetical protein
VADVSTHNALWKIYDRARAASPLTGREFGVGVAAMILFRWAWHAPQNLIQML